MLGQRWRVPVSLAALWGYNQLTHASPNQTLGLGLSNHACLLKGRREADHTGAPRSVKSAHLRLRPTVPVLPLGESQTVCNCRGSRPVTFSREKNPVNCDLVYLSASHPAVFKE